MMFTASEFDEAAYDSLSQRASTGMILRDGFEEIAIGKGKKLGMESTQAETFGPIGKGY